MVRRDRVVKTDRYARFALRNRNDRSAFSFRKIVVLSHRTFSYGRRSERLAFREEIMRIARPRGANTVIRMRRLGSAPRQINSAYVACGGNGVEFNKIDIALAPN